MVVVGLARKTMETCGGVRAGADVARLGGRAGARIYLGHAKWEHEYVRVLYFIKLKIHLAKPTALLHTKRT